MIFLLLMAVGVLEVMGVIFWTKGMQTEGAVMVILGLVFLVVILYYYKKQKKKSSCDCGDCGQFPASGLDCGECGDCGSFDLPFDCNCS